MVRFAGFTMLMVGNTSRVQLPKACCMLHTFLLIACHGISSEKLHILYWNSRCTVAYLPNTPIVSEVTVALFRWPIRELS